MADSDRDLDAYVARASAGRAAFIAAHPHLFLLRLPDVLPPPGNPWDDEFSFTTRVSDGTTPAEEDDDDRPAHAAIIQPVRKRPGGAFPARVGIGRARNCDIVLRFASVSKLHAQFHIDVQPWQLVDLDSANGTFVNDKRLTPRTPHAVQVGDRLKFGVVIVQLVDAASVHDRLKSLAIK